MPASALSSRSSGVSTSTEDGGGPSGGGSMSALSSSSAAAGEQQHAGRRRPAQRRAASCPALGPQRAWRPSRGRSGRRRTTGTTVATGQAPHAGFCAWQQRRPCQIRWWLSIVQSRLGNSAPTACSALTGSVSSVQPNRRASRPKWVSTVIPGMPKALPSTTLAVLRPTPGSSTRSLSRGGTSPSCRSTRAALSLSSDSVLARKNPSGPMIPSRVSRSAAAIAGASG